MQRSIAPIAVALGMVLALSACTDPYDPGQRAVGGGLLGAGAGAAIGGLAGGGRGAAAGALIGWRGWCRRRRGDHATATAARALCAITADSELLSASAAQLLRRRRKPRLGQKDRCLGAEQLVFYACRSNHRTAAIASVTLAQPRATTSPLARATYRPSMSRAIRTTTRPSPSGSIEPA
jgi:hypothetical protein